LKTPAWGTVYNRAIDRGLGCKFWDARGDLVYSEARVAIVKSLFAKKYPFFALDDEPECPYTTHVQR
jgi:hypothetical protein